MQERANAQMPRRNNTDSKALTAKKSNNVKKAGTKSPAVKRASSMRAVRAPQVVTVKKQNKSPFPWAAVLVTAIFTCLFLFMMMNYAQVDSYRSELADLNDKTVTMQKNYDELKAAYTNKYDPGEIVDYAMENFGMVPVETLDYTVITIEQPDKTELHNYDDGEEGGFGFLLNGLGEVLDEFLDN